MTLHKLVLSALLVLTSAISWAAGSVPDTVYCGNHVTCFSGNTYDCAMEGNTWQQANSHPYFKSVDYNGITLQEDKPFQYVQMRSGAAYCVYFDPYIHHDAVITYTTIGGYTFTPVKDGNWSGDTCTSSDPQKCGLTMK